MENETSEPIAKSTRRVVEAAARLGIPVETVVMPVSTRTAEEAASACSTSVAQIVKSLVFRGRDTGEPYLLLVSGANRVDEALVARSIGEPLGRAQADFVREATGFAIGGVPPFGHAVTLVPVLDADLLQFEEVWAAAGTPRAVMRLDPRLLRDRTRARVLAVC
jgi:prolyl-tRNA editing enzyme YbaK/EbsC (Cys-tRNA(Pro) deacylase)